jgi:signal recognition particle subunit SEC65
MKNINQKAEYFIIFNKNQILNILNEISTINTAGDKIVDDGPGIFYSTKNHYKTVSKEIADKLGMTVVNYLIPEKELEQHDTKYPKGPIEGSSYIKTNDNDSEAIKKWKQHMNRIVQRLGFEYVKTLNENVTSSTKFLNDVFNVYQTNKFYITYQNDQIKIARNHLELNSPLNIITIINEGTNQQFINSLIHINTKINELKNKKELFQEGNIFLYFVYDDNIKLIDMIDKNRNHLDSDFLNQFELNLPIH